MVPKYIQDIRDQLAEGREKVRRKHDALFNGAPAGDPKRPRGLPICSALTQLIDNVVSQLLWHALSDMTEAETELFESDMALVALGGYGRSELAPFSDVDLLFLYQPKSKEFAGRVVDRIVQSFWDVQLQLGSSMRTLKECAQDARGDMTIHTALLESRHIAGNEWLTDELRNRIYGLTDSPRRCDAFLDQIFKERLKEQRKFGPTVHWLEPNVKKTRGGLRDYHFFRWVAHARFHIAKMRDLEKNQILSEDEAKQVRQARDLLLALRNELHFEAGRPRDDLTLDHQIRIADGWDLDLQPGKKPVQQFMQDYYRYCTRLDTLSRRFVRREKRPSLTSKILRLTVGIRVGKDYVVSGNEIHLRERAQKKIEHSLERIVALFELSNYWGAKVSTSDRERIFKALPNITDDSLSSARATFFRMLAQPGHLQQTLQYLAHSRSPGTIDSGVRTCARTNSVQSTP